MGIKIIVMLLENPTEKGKHWVRKEQFVIAHIGTVYNFEEAIN